MRISLIDKSSPCVFTRLRESTCELLLLDRYSLFVRTEAPNRIRNQTVPSSIPSTSESHVCISRPHMPRFSKFRLPVKRVNPQCDFYVFCASGHFPRLTLVFFGTFLVLVGLRKKILGDGGRTHALPHRLLGFASSYSISCPESLHTLPPFVNMILFCSRWKRMQSFLELPI